MPNGGGKQSVAPSPSLDLELTVAAGHLHVLEAWRRLHLQEPVQDVLLVSLLVGRPILRSKGY